MSEIRLCILFCLGFFLGGDGLFLEGLGVVVGFFPILPSCNRKNFLLIKLCMPELIFFSLSLATVLFPSSSSSSACKVSTCKDNADRYTNNKTFKVHLLAFMCNYTVIISAIHRDTLQTC